MENPGYHITEIKKGELGEISKLQEELDELKDAHAQQCKQDSEVLLQGWRHKLSILEAQDS